MRRNVASQVVGAQMVSATDGSAFTGSVTCSVTVNGGTQATGATGSGACAHEGNGYHTYVPTQGETNGALVAFTFTGTGAVPVTVQVYTRDYDASGVANVNVAQISGDSAAADNLEAYCDGTTPQPVNVTQLAGSATAATNLSNAADAIATGTVDGSGLTPTTTQFDTSITEATADHYLGRLLIFRTGSLADQQGLISAYSLVSGRGRFTVSALTEAPSNGDAFVIA